MRRPTRDAKAKSARSKSMWMWMATARRTTNNSTCDSANATSNRTTGLRRSKLRCQMLEVSENKRLLTSDIWHLRMIDREQLKFDFYWPATSDAGLDAVFDEALRAMVKKKPHPPVEARFYPYAGLSSTIRIREGRVYARVSDILRRSPRPVLFALACILIGK